MALGVGTQKKNSGILRYTFGGAAEGAAVAEFPALVGQAAAVIIPCLGADADVIPDADNQVFGEFPGHAAITGAANTLFTGSNVAQRNGIQPSEIAIDPTTGQFVNLTGGRYPAFVPAQANNASGFLGGGTKVHAYFQATDADMGLSTVAAESPYVVVQTEVKLNRFYRAGVADTEGPLLIGSIRVAIRNLSDATSLAAGVLIVQLQHSQEDIMGALSQDQTFNSVLPPE